LHAAAQDPRQGHAGVADQLSVLLKNHHQEEEFSIEHPVQYLHHG
jgi:hypothetical protein